MTQKLLVSAETSRKIDAEAQEEWGFNTFGLVEAAGRSCARVFAAAYPGLFRGCFPLVTAVIGTGNNGADALVMLRYLILSGLTDTLSSAVVVSSLPKQDDRTPCSETLRSLKKMKVPVLVWNGDAGKAAGMPPQDALARADIIIDGIAGTGIKGPLKGTQEEMVLAVNAVKAGSGGKSPQGQVLKPHFVVSVDLPSGAFDEWKPGMSVVEAGATIAIEPQKLCLYNPALRVRAGAILPAGEVFPPMLIETHKGAELLDWDTAREFLPPVRPEAFKHQRGAVEIRAGSAGASGAALIAARGAQAAGAGLVRLIVDDAIYPVIASRTGGVMAVPAGQESGSPGRFTPGAVLLGPGWGRTEARAAELEKSLKKEKEGTPLILDADAIALAKGRVFHGRAILTPHPGEFSEYTGIPSEEFLCQPAPLLLKTAEEKKAVIILKGHVITIASPDGRLGVIDGMVPGLAAGGSGDLLAGFCAALAARMAAGKDKGFDAYACACTAAALLIAAGKSEKISRRFTDPMEIADQAADLAGRAWLLSGEE
jgi:NAD(P)H-hydrate epimerase